MILGYQEVEHPFCIDVNIKRNAARQKKKKKKYSLHRTFHQYL